MNSRLGYIFFHFGCFQYCCIFSHLREQWYFNREYCKQLLFTNLYEIYLVLLFDHVQPLPCSLCINRAPFGLNFKGLRPSLALFFSNVWKLRTNLNCQITVSLHKLCHFFQSIESISFQYSYSKLVIETFSIYFVKLAI